MWRLRSCHDTRAATGNCSHSKQQPVASQAAAGEGEEAAAGEGFLGRGREGFDLDADLGSEVETVGTASPVEDFRTLLKCVLRQRLPAVLYVISRACSASTVLFVRMACR